MLLAESVKGLTFRKAPATGLYVPLTVTRTYAPVVVPPVDSSAVTAVTPTGDSSPAVSRRAALVIAVAVLPLTVFKLVAGEAAAMS